MKIGLTTRNTEMNLYDIPHGMVFTGMIGHYGGLTSRWLKVVGGVVGLGSLRHHTIDSFNSESVRGYKEFGQLKIESEKGD